MSGGKGAASMGMTSCASCLDPPAAATGAAERARKESSSLAVTRPEEVHIEPAFLRRENILGPLPSKLWLTKEANDKGKSDIELCRVLDRRCLCDVDGSEVIRSGCSWASR